MISYIFSIFIMVGIIYGFITGNTEGISNAILNSGDITLKMIFKMLPIMCIWLGIINIAQKSGLLKIISKKLTPFLNFLFPEIPKDHEVLSLISTNIVSNMFGLGNAATPVGLKAMSMLQELNNNSKVASRSMITLTLINSCSVTIIPTSVIALRMAHGSNSPTDIVFGSIIVLVLSCLIGIIIDRMYYMVRK